MPYAAALDGNYFAVFGKLHPKYRFPYVSLLVMGAVATAFCVLQLADVIAALVVIRILLQFLLQQVGLLILRKRNPEMPRPFRMWLYPLPALFAIAGFVYILISRPNFLREIRYAVVLLMCRPGAVFRARGPSSRMALGRTRSRAHAGVSGPGVSRPN